MRYTTARICSVSPQPLRISNLTSFPHAYQEKLAAAIPHCEPPPGQGSIWLQTTMACVDDAPQRTWSKATCTETRRSEADAQVDSDCMVDRKPSFKTNTKSSALGKRSLVHHFGRQRSICFVPMLSHAMRVRAAALHHLRWVGGLSDRPGSEPKRL